MHCRKNQNYMIMDNRHANPIFPPFYLVRPSVLEIGRPSHSFRPHHICPAGMGPQLSWVALSSRVFRWGLLCRIRMGETKEKVFLRLRQQALDVHVPEPDVTWSSPSMNEPGRIFCYVSIICMSCLTFGKLQIGVWQRFRRRLTMT